jgi:hypothetical protein
MITLRLLYGVETSKDCAADETLCIRCAYIHSSIPIRKEYDEGYLSSTTYTATYMYGGYSQGLIRFVDEDDKDGRGRGRGRGYCDRVIREPRGSQVH